MFVQESSATVKKVLEKYTDNLTYDADPWVFASM